MSVQQSVGVSTDNASTRPWRDQERSSTVLVGTHACNFHQQTEHIEPTGYMLGATGHPIIHTKHVAQKEKLEATAMTISSLKLDGPIKCIEPDSALVYHTHADADIIVQHKLISIHSSNIQYSVIIQKPVSSKATSSLHPPTAPSLQGRSSRGYPTT